MILEGESDGKRDDCPRERGSKQRASSSSSDPLSLAKGHTSPVCPFPFSPLPASRKMSTQDSNQRKREFLSSNVFPQKRIPVPWKLKFMDLVRNNYHPYLAYSSRKTIHWFLTLAQLTSAGGKNTHSMWT